MTKISLNVNKVEQKPKKEESVENFAEFIKEQEDIELQRQKDFKEDILKQREEADKRLKKKMSVIEDLPKEKQSKARSKIKKEIKAKEDRDKKIEKEENFKIPFNDEYYNEYKKRLRENKLKKIAFTVGFFGILIGLLCFNVYFTFIRETTSIDELTNQVIQKANINDFPVSSVQGYLNSNLETILGNGIIETAGASSNWTVESINIEKIAVKSSQNANVYFSAEIYSDVGHNTHRFMVPLIYDYETKGLKLGGEVNLLTKKNSNSTEINKTNNYSFEGLEKSDDTQAVTNFLDNFFLLLYNEHKDVSDYYSKSKNLGDENLKYIQITSLAYYKGENAAGCNTMVKYKVQGTEELTYEITSYMKIVKDSNGKYTIENMY